MASGVSRDKTRSRFFCQRMCEEFGRFWDVSTV